MLTAITSSLANIPLSVSEGGTDANTAAGALANLGAAGIASTLSLKGVFPSTDFDDYSVETGIYRLDGTTRTNGPAIYAWSHMIVINDQWQMQIVFTSSNIYTRKRTGSPEQWSAWLATR